MSDSAKSFNETAVNLARNPLGIIALFIVLVYGFASLGSETEQVNRVVDAGRVRLRLIQ